MGEHSQSFLLAVRSKLNRRSHSSPPDAGNQRGLPQWKDPPVEYQPVPTYNPPPLPAQYAQRKTSEHRSKAAPIPPDPYAKYDPRMYHAASVPQHRHTVPRKATRQSMSTPPPPLLQLPKPRSMWRRSLETLSPTKRSEGWDTSPPATRPSSAWDEPEQAKRMTVDLACALPPQYLDHPPHYESVYEVAKDIRASNPWADSQQQQHSYHHQPQPQHNQQYWQTKPQITMTGPPQNDNSQYGHHSQHPAHPNAYSGHEKEALHDVTIDNLLQHPLLRPR